MLLKKHGQTYRCGGKSFSVGMEVYAIDSDYEGLYGFITEIRSGKHKETGNEGADIYCSFFPPIDIETENILEERMSSVHGDAVRFDDIAIDLVIMAPEMLRQAKKCRVYQLYEHERTLLFQSYERVKSLGVSAPSGSQYHVVYDGYLHTDKLEEIFYLLNCNHPEGYNGWSLSLSDIVELYDNNEHAYYYCDTFGFEKIPFVPIEQEERHV